MCGRLCLPAHLAHIAWHWPSMRRRHGNASRSKCQMHARCSTVQPHQPHCPSTRRMGTRPGPRDFDGVRQRQHGRQHAWVCVPIDRASRHLS